MGDPHRPEDWLGGSTEQKHTVPKAKDTAGDLDRGQAIGEKKRQLKELDALTDFILVPSLNVQQFQPHQIESCYSHPDPQKAQR